MIDIVIGSTYQDRQRNRIQVLDIAENPKNKSRVVIYKKNKEKKPFQSFYDTLLETIQRKEMI